MARLTGYISLLPMPLPAPRPVRYEVACHQAAVVLEAELLDQVERVLAVVPVGRAVPSRPDPELLIERIEGELHEPLLGVALDLGRVLVVVAVVPKLVSVG